MSKRSDVDILSTNYKSFKGVDFTTDPSLVDRQRSPLGTNMISDEGGNPEKRPGYKKIKDVTDHVYGLFRAEFNGTPHYLVHAGTKLYRWYLNNTASVQLATGFPENRSKAVYLNGKLWIFTGSGLYVYDGSTVSLASANAYVPTVIIGASPSTGGGTTYEGINYLTGKQKCSYLGDSSTVYQLPYTSVDAVNEVTVDGSVTTAYTVDLTTGKVTFTSAHPTQVEGQDNVVITYTKNFSGYADRINHCTTAIAWGVNGIADRIVCAGDPDYPNIDYISGYMDATYWPDTDYQVVGSGATRIMGYRRSSSSLAIIKEDNGQDATIFIRSGSLDDDGNAIWATYPCISGVGGVSFDGFGNINDDQLILTGQGVYALTTNTITAEKIAENRSVRLNPKMKKEMLSEAVCESFRNMFMVFVGEHVYILDGRQAKSYESRNDTTYTYEGYYWENVPAACVLKTSDDGIEQLYFGTEDGEIMQFMFDESSVNRYSDGGYDNNGTWVSGEAIECVWATKADDDGDPMILKTLLKKGNAVTLKPYARSSAQVCIRTDKDTVDWKCNESSMDIFDWTDIDFSRFTFNSNDGPREVPFNRKVKNYKRLQIIIRNNNLNEGMGVYGIVKHYVTGNFSKK